MIGLVRFAVVFSLAVVTAGCTGRNALTLSGVGDSLKQSLGMADPPAQPIQRIVPIWKAARGQDMQGRPCRGAAGQILFFAAGSDKAVKLEGEGEVAVYVFDDQGKPEDRAKPLHIFRFDMPSWNRHLHVDSQLGPGYHVFIPYTRNVVTAAQMSLNVRLIPKRGMPASSEMVTVSLPGPHSKGGTKLEVVSRPTGKKVNVSTFKPDEFLNGAKSPSTDSAQPKETEKPVRSSAVFHDFNLQRKTQVRSLGPMRQVAPEEPTALDQMRGTPNERLRKILATLPDRPTGNRANVTIDDRHSQPAPRRFRLGAPPTAANDRAVVPAEYERKDRHVRHSLHTRPAAGSGPFVGESTNPTRERGTPTGERGIPTRERGNPFDNGAADAPRNQPSARNLLEGDAAAELSTKRPRPQSARPDAHPLVDDQAAWPDK